MFEFLFSENTFFGFICGVVLVLGGMLLTAFIGAASDEQGELYYDDEPDEIFLEDSYYNDGLIEEEKCPFVEGTVRAEDWHKRTGR